MDRGLEDVRKEIAILKDCEHPNIVQYHGPGPGGCCDLSTLKGLNQNTRQWGQQTVAMPRGFGNPTNPRVEGWGGGADARGSPHHKGESVCL